MVRSRSRLVAVALVVGISAAACGGGGGDGGANSAIRGVAGSDAPGDQAAPAAGDPAASNNGASGSAANGASGSGANSAGGASASSAKPASSADPNSGQAGGANGSPAGGAAAAATADQVDGAPVTRTPDDPTPQGCSMQRGSKCQLRIQGSYTLTTADVANIRVAAYEDGSKDPASSTTLPNAKKGHSGWYVDHFLYVVSNTAKQVTFQVTLLSPTGAVLAQGRANTVPIP